MSSDEHQVPLEAEESGAQTVEPETAAAGSSEDPAAPIQPEAQAGSPSHSVPVSDADVERQISRMSRRSLLWGAAAVATGLAGQRWLITRRDDDGVPWPFRRALEINEELARDYFKPSRLAPVFPRALAGTPRENGDLGLSDDFDPATWRLTVVRGAGKGGEDTSDDSSSDDASSDDTSAKGPSSADAASDDQSVDGTSSTDDLKLTLADIQALPRVEMVTELKCIEGWSQVVHWAGARLADFIARYPPPTRSSNPPDVRNRPDDLPGYVSLETPDGGYYVGLDMESALHPQTLLCYEMNGQPLTLAHGAPLRLVIPVKYGIKNIKRIGTIRFTNQRPADYWAEQGYDWYSGH